MSKEQFLYKETKPVFDLIEEESQRSGVSRGVAFEDFLAMSVCAMSGGTMEDQYMAVVERHKHGKPGKRGCDSIARAFGKLVASMEQTQGKMIDVLGKAQEFMFTTPLPGQEPESHNGSPANGDTERGEDNLPF